MYGFMTLIIVNVIGRDPSRTEWVRDGCMIEVDRLGLRIEVKESELCSKSGEARELGHFKI